MKQLLEGKICLCNMLIIISPHELRSLATQCNMATVLTRGFQSLSYAHGLVLCLLLSLLSQMKQQREGGKDNNNKTVQKCVKKFASVVKWEQLLQKRNRSCKYVETGASKRRLPWEVR